MALRSEERHGYQERCNKLELQNLQVRRRRGELIQFFKIHKGLEEVSWSKDLLEVPPRANKRGQYRREIVKSCNQRHHFFTNRTINSWNDLPDELVNVGSVNKFKQGLDDWIVRKGAAF